MRTFTVYQSKERDYCFLGYDRIVSYLKKQFDIFSPEMNYKKVYTSSMLLGEDDMSALNEIYEILNTCHPDDYNTRSLSVSDVVKLGDNFYFVDSFGFKLLPILPATLQERIAGVFKDNSRISEEEMAQLLGEIKALEDYKAETFWRLTKKDSDNVTNKIIGDDDDGSFSAVTDNHNLDDIRSSVFEMLECKFSIEDWEDVLETTISIYLSRE